MTRDRSGRAWVPAVPILVLLLAAAPARGEGPTDDGPAPLSETQRIHHFLNRFSLGPTPELMAEVRKIGVAEWLEAQLDGRVGGGSEMVTRLEPLESLGLTSRQIMERYVKPIPDGAPPELRRARQRLRNVPRDELLESVILQAVYNRAQVREVAADFWRQHFCISVDKGPCQYYATEYERKVIRGLAFARFGEILEASAKHPAMLVYLDNFISRRAPTKAELNAIEIRVRLATGSREQGELASDIAAQRGLNENYARELLELHTLGVDNGYTQRDVESVARALTGWTFESDPARPIEFTFREAMHEPGDKPFLRGVIREDRKNGVREGERILEILKKHEGTARFVAWKLCRHFVCDDPPADLVDRIAAVFRKNDGDLRAVYRAIAADEELFAPRHYRAKLKRPFEYVISALRVTGAEIKNVSGILQALAAMKESTYRCLDPTGYYDQAEAWQDPGAFAVRWKFAMDLAHGRLRGVTLPESLYDRLYDTVPDAWKDQLVRELLPTGLSARTSDILDGLVERLRKENPEYRVREIGPYLVGAILGSPDFQKQ